MALALPVRRDSTTAFLIAKLNVPSIIVTLGTMFLARGSGKSLHRVRSAIPACLMRTASSAIWLFPAP